MKRFAVIAAGVLLVLGSAAAQAQTVPARPLGPKAEPTFKQLDRDHDGRVTLDEVLAYAKKKSAQVKPFRITDADLDGDGVLTVEEQHKAGITGLEKFGAVNLKEMDLNGDGYISREDLDEYFRRKHQEAFAQADADKDKALRPSEFALFRF